MKCRLCGTIYEGENACPYCGMPAIAELDGGGVAGSLCIEHRQRIISRLGSLSVVAYRYEQAGRAAAASNRRAVAGRRANCPGPYRVRFCGLPGKLQRGFGNPVPGLKTEMTERRDVSLR